MHPSSLINSIYASRVGLSKMCWVQKRCQQFLNEAEAVPAWAWISLYMKVELKLGSSLFGLWIQCCRGCQADSAGDRNSANVVVCVCGLQHPLCLQSQPPILMEKANGQRFRTTQLLLWKIVVTCLPVWKGIASVSWKCLRTRSMRLLLTRNGCTGQGTCLKNHPRTAINQILLMLSGQVF